MLNVIIAASETPMSEAVIVLGFLVFASVCVFCFFR